MKKLLFLGLLTGSLLPSAGHAVPNPSHSLLTKPLGSTNLLGSAGGPGFEDLMQGWKGSPLQEMATSMRIFRHPLVFRGWQKKLLGVVRGEMVFFQEDIALGRLSEVDEITGDRAALRDPGEVKVAGNGLAGLQRSRFLWPKGIIPYVVDQALQGKRDVILSAMQEWGNKTHVTFVDYKNEKSFLLRELAGYSRKKYTHLWRLHFVAGKKNYSWSYPGLRELTGEAGVAYHQPLVLQAGFTRRTALHEIGHALGLLHEQLRTDRDKYLTLHKGRIQKEHLDQYDLTTGTLGTPIGDYDFASIMHYATGIFGKPGAGPTFTVLSGSLDSSASQIGRGKHLSAGDIASVNTLYPQEAPEPQVSRPAPNPKPRTKPVRNAETQHYLQLILARLPSSHPSSLKTVREVNCKPSSLGGTQVIRCQLVMGSNSSKKILAYQAMLHQGTSGAYVMYVREK
jgi:hypothetical protein